MKITSVAILLSFCFAAALAFNTGRIQDHHPIPRAHPRPPPPKSMLEARQKLMEQAKQSTAAHRETAPQMQKFKFDAETIMQGVPKSNSELKACAEQTCEDSK